MHRKMENNMKRIYFRSVKKLSILQKKGRDTKGYPVHMYICSNVEDR
jgi:hypothetical protein